jgi:antitoxin component of RelBE/YafQ-DinJ toxin-antitoxin module
MNTADKNTYTTANLSLTLETKALAKDITNFYGINFSSLVRMLLLKEARELGLAE